MNNWQRAVLFVVLGMVGMALFQGMSTLYADLRFLHKARIGAEQRPRVPAQQPVATQP